MKLVKFKADHLQKIRLQEAQQELSAEFGNPDYGLALEREKHAFTGIHNGEVIFCAGLHELWEGRSIGWALIGQSAPRHFRAIHLLTQGFLKQVNCRRIETLVDDSFQQGHRWAKMLGFEKEGVMKYYSPTGKDYALYARIKHG